MNNNEHMEFIDRITVYCLAALVFVLPIAHMRALRAVLMLVPALLWVYRMIFRKEKLFIKNQLMLPWFVFIIFSGLSLFTAIDLRYSVRELLGTIVNFSLFCLFLNNIKTMKQVNVIILSLLLGSLVQAIYGAIHFFYGHMSLLDFYSAEHALEVDHKYYSTYLITVLPFIMYKITTSRGKARPALIGLMALNLFMVVASQQRGAWVAAGVEIAIFLWYVNRKLLFPLLGVIVVALTLLPSTVLYHGKKGIDLDAQFGKGREENSITPRIEIWKFSLHEIVSHPFAAIGIGRRSFVKRYRQFQNSDTWHAHNVFLDMALELGIQGLLAFLCMMFVLARTFLEGFRKASVEAHYWFLASFVFLIGFFVRNMFDDLYIDDLVQMFWAISGISFAVFLRMENIPYGRLLFKQKQAAGRECLAVKSGL